MESSLDKRVNERGAEGNIEKPERVTGKLANQNGKMKGEAGQSCLRLNQSLNHNILGERRGLAQVRTSANCDGHIFLSYQSERRQYFGKRSQASEVAASCHCLRSAGE